MKQLSRFKASMTAIDFLAAAGRAGGGSASSHLLEFEKEFSRRFGVRHAILAPAARGALEAILRAADLPRGGEVLVPALTFHSVPETIERVGLRVAFVDVDPDTYVLDSSAFERAIKSNTVAIVPTHLYGRACPMDAVTAIARERNLMVIEDCAQACGGRFGERRLGSIGDAAFFSFGPTKNLAMLWCGMATTDDDRLARSIRAHLGELPRIPALQLARRIVFALAMRAAAGQAVWRILGAPMVRFLAERGSDPIESATAETPAKAESTARDARRMPGALQARIGLRQLARLDESNARRIANGERLASALRDVPGVEIVSPTPEGENIFMSFPVRVDDREAVRRRLLRLGVDTTFGYMSACPASERSAINPADFPVAFDAARRMLHLPVYPELSASDVDWIARAVRRAVGVPDSLDQASSK